MKLPSNLKKIPVWVWIVGAIVLLGGGVAAVETAATVPPKRGKKGGMGSADTSDWTDTDLTNYLAFCAAIGAPYDVPVRVWAFESNNTTTAHNAGGASGIFQLTEGTAADIGYPVESDPDLSAFRAMNVSQQLVWATKFYGAHRGQIGSVARFYVSTFLPALLAHADDPDFALCGKNGPYAGFYKDNAGLDTAGKGYITPADLVAATVRATGPRTNALLARISAAQPMA
jgi:hypothetical protein